MKARNLAAALTKTDNPDLEVTIAIENSEKEFEVLGVSDSVGKKIIAVRLIEKDGAITAGDSIENQPERTAQETEETKDSEGTTSETEGSLTEKPEEIGENASDSTDTNDSTSENAGPGPEDSNTTTEENHD